MCLMPGCEKKVYCREMCRSHYEKAKRQGAFKLRQYGVKVCSVKGCSATHEAHGYCQRHYDKWRLYGDPLAVTRKDPSFIEELDGVLHVHLGGERADGVVALVSREDRAVVEGHSWWMNVNGYAAGKQEGKQVLLHRLLLDCPRDRQVDHINGKRLDNRRENLRVVTFAEQMQNKKPWGKSGYRNVHPDGYGRWRVIVTKDGKRHSGGRFTDVALAVAAAEDLRGKLFTHHVEDRTSLD